MHIHLHRTIGLLRRTRACDHTTYDRRVETCYYLVQIFRYAFDLSLNVWEQQKNQLNIQKSCEKLEVVHSR